MWNSLPTLAGALATVVFAVSALPMLIKAARTKDLTSYSKGNLMLANVGNAFYSVYVFHLPPGPVWFLHGFYIVSSALMLIWSSLWSPARRRAVHESTHVPSRRMGTSPDALAAPKSLA